MSTEKTVEPKKHKSEMLSKSAPSGLSPLIFLATIPSSASDSPPINKKR